MGVVFSLFVINSRVYIILGVKIKVIKGLCVFRINLYFKILYFLKLGILCVKVLIREVKGRGVEFWVILFY